MQDGEIRIELGYRGGVETYTQRNGVRVLLTPHEALCMLHERVKADGNIIVIGADPPKMVHRTGVEPALP